MEASREIGTLLQRAIPELISAEGQRLRVRTALRWFLGWREEPFVELKFVRLWIVMEMLASRYWNGQSGDPKGKQQRVGRYLEHLDIPQRDQAPLGEMWCARNAIVHGDPDLAYDRMSDWFGSLVEERRAQLQSPFLDAADPLPDPSSYGACMTIASDTLSRLLEKVFLNLFNCRDLPFFSAPLRTGWAP